MKNLEKYIILVISIVAVVAIAAAIYFMKNQNTSFTKSKYQITYFDNYEPGTTYDILIDDNYNVLKIEQPNCSTVDCLEGKNYPKAKTTRIKVSDKGKEKIKKFVEEIFKNQGISALDMNDSVYNKFTDEQKKVYTALFNNDEEIMFK